MEEEKQEVAVEAKRTRTFVPKIEEGGDKVSEPVKVKKTSKKSFFNNLARLLFLVVTTVAIYSSYQLYILKKPDYQQQQAKKQTDHIISAVSRLIEIPTDTPQVATVADVDTLKKTQPFFEKAQNGDSLLVFLNEAILYRESINKIINVAAVTRNTAPAVTAPTSTDTTGASATKTPDTKTPVKK
jgi:hypothetical protein